MRKFTVHPKSTITASEDIGITYDIIYDLLSDAQDEIPYALAPTESEFIEAATTYIQNRLVSEHNYSAEVVNSTEVADYIEEIIINEQGNLW